ncbi:MAG: ATP-grasp domain-containing protein [Lysobacteraceae bacterium]
MTGHGFTNAFIEEQGNGRLCHESALVAESLARQGLPFECFTPKKILKRVLPLSPDTFVAGTIPVVLGVLKQLGIDAPPANDYPEALHPWLHRRVWRATLRDVEAGVWEGAPAVFAKSADRLKSFTGRVFRGSDDLYFLGNVSRRQAVWCSEVVQWHSEYRVYVIRDRAVSIDHYAGDASVSLAPDIVQAAMARYRDAGAPAAYAVDFGVLADGRTALVEANEGYGLGAYAIGADAYTDLLMTRWSELVSGSTRSADEAWFRA